MAKRFITIWFRHLITDWLTLRRPELQHIPFVVTEPDHGRLIIMAVNNLAEVQGLYPGIAAADAKAMIPSLEVIDNIPGINVRLLKALGEWCIRYSPMVAVDLPDGLILDATGCAHLWGGESSYLNEIYSNLKTRGYHARIAMSDTIGTSWAVSRFGQNKFIIEDNGQASALLSLPPAALRLEQYILERLHKLGLRTINSFINMPRAVLRRRFGMAFLTRIDQALGLEEETVIPLQPVEPFQERLPCLEPICTATGIEIALQQLLETVCTRLEKESKGIRKAIFRCFRIDGKIVEIQIGTNRASNHIQHLYKLFELKIDTIEPGLGIDVFILSAPKVEDVVPFQESLWAAESCGLNDPGISELLDRVAGKVGTATITRYLPDEHYWPERSVKTATSLVETPAISWQTSRPRPVHLLPQPELIEVTAPIPDYPPMMFRYKGNLHKIKKADGPERIEPEWWLEGGNHRDYYNVEDEKGQRYWLFRSGHYGGKNPQWFMHGFFA